MLSPCSIVGIHTCTVGVSNAPKTESTTSSTLITVNALLSDKRSVAHKTDIPVNPSSPTIILRLSALSARIPPNGERTIVGIMAIDNIPANIAAEPVTSSTYMDNASFKMKFPNNDVNCPKIRSTKFFVNNFYVMAHFLHRWHQPKVNEWQ